MYIFKYALLAIVFDMFTSSYKCVYISSEALNTTSTYILRTYVVYTRANFSSSPDSTFSTMKSYYISNMRLPIH